MILGLLLHAICSPADPREASCSGRFPSNFFEGAALDCLHGGTQPVLRAGSQPFSPPPNLLYLLSISPLRCLSARPRGAPNRPVYGHASALHAGGWGAER